MRRDAGQVAVEAALVLPLWAVMALMAVQLTLIQQARSFTEYAAYSAVRAGSVWSANGERMRDAALFAVLPMQGATQDLDALARTWRATRETDAQISEALGAVTPVPAAFRRAGLLGMIRVDVIAPARSSVRDAEADFDDGAAPPLSIRVRYLYELRIPVAAPAMFYGWLAAQAGRAITNPLELRGSRSDADSALEIRVDHGLPIVSRADLDFLWRAAAGEARTPGRRFFLPLAATWSQPMQSNLQRKWLMHEGGAL